MMEQRRIARCVQCHLRFDWSETIWRNHFGRCSLCRDQNFADFAVVQEFELLRLRLLRELADR